MELAVDSELVTVVGELPGVSEGEELIVTGFYTTHPSFGAQFKATMFERSLPTTVASIYKYLASGAIKGIGASTARRIVDRFGPQALQIIEHSPERLAEISGVSEKKAAAIGTEFQRIHGIRAVMAYLSAYSIRTECIIAAWKKWGLMTCDIVAENPYALCDEDIGVRFEEAEDIRCRLDLPPDLDCRVQAGLVYVLRHNTGNGHTCLPRDKLLAAAQSLLQLGLDELDLALDRLTEDEKLTAATVEGREFLYIPEYYSAERYCAGRLALFQALAAPEAPDCSADIAQLEQQNGIQYEALQKQAIQMAMSSPLLVLTGGPGTGKTTTLNAIIALFLKNHMRVALAAPTGRAAKRMTELTGREAKTIHRLLEVDFSSGSGMNFVHTERNPLLYDAVVIDEMSMVDLQLFEALLRAVRLSCKIILVGDSDQLPSVGAGNVLGDIIASGRFAVVELKEIFRQAAESLIVTNAHRIIAGEPPELGVRSSDFFFLQSAFPERTAKTVCDLCVTRLPRTYQYSPLWDIQVLCPSRQGEIGTASLNRRLQQLLNPPDGKKKEMQAYGVTYREGDKVMQIRNNYDIQWEKEGEAGAGVFNGDIGILLQIDRPNGFFKVQFDDRVATYDLEAATEIEHAYAVTVHKSQGSEFEAVIIPLQDWHQRLYYRKLLYTAVTRAKRLLILVGRPDTVYRMVESNRRTLRYSNLRAFIEEEFERGQSR